MHVQALSANAHHDAFELTHGHAPRSGTKKHYALETWSVFFVPCPPSHVGGRGGRGAAQRRFFPVFTVRAQKSRPTRAPNPPNMEAHLLGWWRGALRLPAPMRQTFSVCGCSVKMVAVWRRNNVGGVV